MSRWQVAVAESERGNGLGSLLLKELMGREICEDIRYLETIISPSNHPSQALFRGFARDLSVECKISECFPAHLFPGSVYEPEMTFRIGPFY
ncbi:GNAT family N-acetyltransferase [Aneurinibacillus tyrosinisolvens]|uniref:GNAT family N-acetyltransferase n=1 Tax=Aneurinibacillus tyrosinisolvens TaxID=1443435 RepID=UPI0034E1F601